MDTTQISQVTKQVTDRDGILHYLPLPLTKLLVNYPELHGGEDVVHLEVHGRYLDYLMRTLELSLQHGELKRDEILEREISFLEAEELIDLLKSNIVMLPEIEYVRGDHTSLDTAESALDTMLKMFSEDIVEQLGTGWVVPRVDLTQTRLGQLESALENLSVAASSVTGR